MKERKNFEKIKISRNLVRLVAEISAASDTLPSAAPKFRIKVTSDTAKSRRKVQIKESFL